MVDGGKPSDTARLKSFTWKLHSLKNIEINHSPNESTTGRSIALRSSRWNRLQEDILPLAEITSEVFQIKFPRWIGFRICLCSEMWKVMMLLFI